MTDEKLGDWQKGNGYHFCVTESPEHCGWFISNIKYGLILKSKEDAILVANLLNNVLIHNGDGISKSEFAKKLNKLEQDYHDKEPQFMEKILIEKIFNDIRRIGGFE